MSKGLRKKSRPLNLQLIVQRIKNSSASCNSFEKEKSNRIFICSTLRFGVESDEAFDMA
jgi:hypothetical protein